MLSRRQSNFTLVDATSQPNIPFLCRFEAPRQASAVFIAFPRAPLVICEALKRAWCRQWTFYRAAAFFCRTHTHRLSVIKFRRMSVEARIFAVFHDIPTAALFEMLQSISIYVSYLNFKTR